MMGSATGAGTVRINPVGLSRVAQRIESAMGIVRLLGRDVRRLSAEAREREGRPALRDAPEIAHDPLAVAASSMAIVLIEGAGHSAADRTRVRHR